MVRCSTEQQVARSLEQAGIGAFAPTVSRPRTVRGKATKTVAALYPGYAFGQFDADQLFRVLNLPNVLGVVRIGRQLAAVPPEELHDIRLMIEQQQSLAMEPAKLLPGDRVVLTGGPLQGLSGTLDRQSSKLFVGVSLLGFGVSVQVQRDWVKHAE